MRSHTRTILALAGALALAACGGASDEEPVLDGSASGNSPERASAVNDTTPYRPGQPDANPIPETRP